MKKNYLLLLFLFLFSMLFAGAVKGQGFITTWKTDNPGTSGATEILIPTNGTNYDYDVDWGDGTNDTNLTGDATHMYASAGTYTVTITRDFPSIYFDNAGDKEKILTVEQWGDIAWSTMSRAFWGCSNLDVVATDAPDLGNVTSLDYMFSGASTMNGAIGHWEVGTITSMNSLLYEASSFNQDLNDWDVSAVTNMQGLFMRSGYTGELNDWDVSSVTNMVSMFRSCEFNSDISMWTTTSLENISGMYLFNTNFNQDISVWDVSNVTAMQTVFNAASAFDQDLSSWDVSRVTIMSGMFSNSGMSQENYDKTLEGWYVQPLQDNVTLDAANITYCEGSVARQSIIDNYSWIINDAGENCNNITFPDANFKAALLAHDPVIDLNGNGEITDSEAETFTGTLDVSNLSISDLVGIEYFINTVGLNAGVNSLSSVDLSANTYLEELDLRNNELTQIDLSNNPILTNVGLSDNELSSLDVSNLADLTTLTLRGNQIPAIDVSNNTELIDLYIHSNNLTSLDVSNNLNLEELLVDSNELTSLDLSNNTSLTWLRASDTQLTSLDLTLNTVLRQFQIDDVDQLKSINIANGNNTNIAQFSVVNNPNLTCIQVDDVAFAETNFTDVDEGTIFVVGECPIEFPDANFKAALVAHDPVIDTNSDGEISASEAEAFTGTMQVNLADVSDVSGLEYFINLETLFLNSNASLSTIDVSSNTALEHLEFANCDVSEIDLSNNLALRFLRAGNNNLSSLDLSNNAALIEINVNDNNLSALDVTSCPDLQTLLIRQNSLTAIHVGNNLNLKTLNADNNSIESLDLSNNQQLTSVSLFRNSLKEIQLPSNSDMETLVAPENQLSSIDVSVLESLTQLRIHENQLTDLDISSNEFLTVLSAGGDNDLRYVNAANGSNASFTTFNFANSPNLTCVQVDDVAYATANFTDVDDTSVFTDVECAIFFPDANFKAALVAHSPVIDTNSDGEIQYSEAVAFTGEIDVAGKEINDLTGIAAFINLSILDVNTNDLTEIDVSNNTALNRIAAYGNDLEGIDLSNNTSISTLNLDGNPIGTLDVSMLPDLFTIQCSSCELSEIDVTSNPLLQTLWVAGNELTSLDLSQNPALRNALFNSNPLTAIDLSFNPAVVEVRVQNTSITSLDLSANVNLERLSAQNSQLNSLNVANGMNSIITRFEAANNPNLTCIQVDDVVFAETNFTDIDEGTIFVVGECPLEFPDANFKAALVAHDPVIDTNEDGEITLSEAVAFTGTINVSQKEIEDLTGIEAFSNLTRLDCSENSLTSLNISSNTQLTYLNCDFNGITGLDVSGNTALTDLNLYGNQIANLDVSQNVLLTQLQCGENNLTTLDVSSLTALNTLNCYNNDLTNLDVSALPNLESLRVYSNPLTALDISANTELTLLDVHNAEFTSLDVSSNPKLVLLTAYKNELTNLDLSQNPLLTRVDVSTNQLEELNVNNLSALEHLNIGRNEIARIDLAQNASLESFTAYETALTHLDFSENASMTQIRCYNNELVSLNIANGTNTIITSFNATGNPNLNCIQVDDVGFAEANFTDVDETASFNTDCSIPFVTTWKTDNPGTSEDNQITIPTEGTGYNYTVDWGDESSDEGVTGDVTHTYAEAGTYTVSISGDFPRIFFNNEGDKEKLLTIEQWGTIEWGTMELAFRGCVNMTSTANDQPNLANVENMSSMFANCTSFNSSLNNWDVRNVTNMQNLFGASIAFNGDISSWDVSNVTNMNNVFLQAAAFNQDISQWDVSNVTSMRLIFARATAFNVDIGAWDVGNLTSLFDAFAFTDSFDQDISTWDISTVSDMDGIFDNSGLSPANYDAILEGWSLLTLQSDVNFGAVGVTYCESEEARQSIIDNFNWTITDGGLDCKLSSETDIITFDFSDLEEEVIINTTAHTVEVEVPVSTDMTNLTPTFTLSEGANSDPESGTVQDFTSPVTYTVNAEDEATSQAWTVTVIEQNEAPTDITFFSRNVDENSPIGTRVSFLEAIDANESDTHTYSLVTGEGDTDNDSFVINEVSLELNFVPDFEVKNEYTIRVQTDDSRGGIFQKAQVITINDLDENTVPTLSGFEDITREEGFVSLQTDLVEQFNDADGDSLTFEVTSSNTSVVTVAFDAQQFVIITEVGIGSSDITMTASDGNGGSVSGTLTFTITEKLNEAPTDITLSATTIAENEESDALIGTFNTIDENTEDLHTYILVDGDGSVDNASFTIEGDELRARESFDFETKSNYSIRIETNDGNGGTFQKAFTISIIDVDENTAPVVSSPITDLEETEGFISLAIDLSQVFSDADNDVLAYNAISSNTNVVTATIGASDQLVLTEIGIGTSTILVTADDQMGGTAIEEFTVMVKEKPLGLETEIEIKIYPNPVLEVLYMESNKQMDVRLLDLNGKMLKSDSGTYIEMNLDKLSKGVYLINVEQDGKTINRRVIKAN